MACLLLTGCSRYTTPLEPYPLPELYLGPYVVRPYVYPSPYFNDATHVYIDFYNTAPKKKKVKRTKKNHCKKK